MSYVYTRAVSWNLRTFTSPKGTGARLDALFVDTFGSWVVMGNSGEMLKGISGETSWVVLEMMVINRREME